MHGPQSVLLCLGTVSLLWAQSKTPFTNDDVLKLVRAGFSETVVLEAIEVNEARFDVSPQSLLALKEAGVSDGVMSAMMSKAQAQETQGEPDTAHFKPGVYVRINGKYVEMEPDILNWSATPLNFPGYRKRPISVRLLAEVFGPRSKLTLTPETEVLFVCPPAVPGCRYEHSCPRQLRS